MSEQSVVWRRLDKPGHEFARLFFDNSCWHLNGTAITWQSVTIPAGTLHRTRAEGRTVNLCFEKLGAETVFPDAPEKPQKSI